ncbi:Hypothetical_protein [Hexamita inflata]|uniref:Hypothetical_protein n=1 Tax=Hexamita inflata TaxID=28002 RepID=A0AA86NFT4_9EUKA|nr:Hypothetical protein HINF_LOCUS6564 [Hexamita inflata]
MKLEQLYSESSSERLAFGMDGSGCGRQNPRVSEKLVPSRLQETGIDFTVLVCFDRSISGKKARLVEDFGNELANTNRLGQMNEQVLDGFTELLESELTCLFTGLQLQDFSVSHSLPRVRIHGHQSDSSDFTLNRLHFV